jgi:hypothetical protein
MQFGQHVRLAGARRLQFRIEREATMPNPPSRSTPQCLAPHSISIPAAALLLKRDPAHLYRLCKSHQLGHAGRFAAFGIAPAGQSSVASKW